MQCRAHCAPSCPALGRVARKGSQGIPHMKTIVLGAGIIGISTAWHLLERGHEVIVVDRQPDAALETSFANAAQISVSYCEPWANREAPLKALKWMFDKEAPLLFRPQMDWQQWRWGLQFLAQCNDAAFERNVQQIVALGAYSHAALKDLVSTTGIEYNRLERGIAHFYTDQKSFDAAGHAVELMRKHGVQRRLVSRDELLKIEPAFKAYGDKITGGTYTSTDESGDARVFTQELARRCMARGARLRRRGGVALPIYPGKGYSATFPLLKPEGAPMVSTIDDGKKIAMSRLGNYLRVAGTIELNGWDLTLDSSLARARCHML